MNTVQLECFVTVAEYLNFSKASRALKLTQPAVSHQIQTLEEELGVKLFNRTSRSVSITQEGLLFLTDAHLILRTAMSAKERLESHENFIHFDLGCCDRIVLDLLPPVLEKLSAEFPLLRPGIQFFPFPALMGMIENGQIHAALGIKNEQRTSSLLFKKLCSVPVACVCAPGHPLSGYKALTADRLCGSLIACPPRQMPEPIVTLQGSLLSSLSPSQRFFSENIESAFIFAKARLGYTLYPDIPHARQPGLCYIPVTDLPRIPFGVYCRYGNDQPVIKRFHSLMSEYIRAVPDPALGSADRVRTEDEAQD